MRRKTLALVFVLAATVAAGALAQTMNHGKHLGAGVPAVPSAILVNTGVKLLVNTGIVLMEHN